MRKFRFASLSAVFALMLILSACNAFGPQIPPTPDPLVIQSTIDAAATQAVLTIAAQLTGTALAQPTHTVPANAGKYSATWKLLMDGTTLCTLPVSIEAVTP